MNSNQNQIQKDLLNVVRCARTGEYGNLASQLNLLVQQLERQLREVQGVTAEAVKKLAYSMETMLLMQEQEDWVAFADVVEYEFLPLWKDVLGEREGLKGKR